MKKQFRKLALLSLFGGILLLSGCDKDDEAPVVPAGINLLAGSTILTDEKGQTLYFFSKDTNGQSSCTSAGCLGAWPVFYIETPVLGTGLVATDFGTITRTDGLKQTTYKGWPLYYFSPTNDGKLENPGETKGEGVGGVWFVAKSNYAIMITNAQLVGADGKNYTTNAQGSVYTEAVGSTFYFVDAKTGRTVYRHAPDKNGINNFSNGVATHDANWPVFSAQLPGSDMPFGLNKEDFQVIMSLGGQQLTYKGWPLYYYVSDAVRGNNKGISVGGGAWPIVNSSTAVAPN